MLLSYRSGNPDHSAFLELYKKCTKYDFLTVPVFKMWSMIKIDYNLTENFLNEVKILYAVFSLKKTIIN